MKKILFAITAAAIMIVAATMVPAVNCNESDVDEYIVNTVEVKDNFQSYLDSINEKATKNMTYDKEDCSYSLNTSAYEIYGNQEFDDAQLSVTMDENGLVSNYGNIDFNDDADVSEKGTIVSDSDTECDSDYTLVYDDNGYVSDIMIVIDGQECSARELYDPMDNCFVWVLIPVAYEIVKWCLFFTIIILVWNFISMHFANTDEGFVYVDEEEDVVDGIKIGKKNGNIVAVSIWGQDYKVSDKNKLNDSNATREKDNYHFALKLNEVYVFPSTISKNTAQDIIMLPNEMNRNGMYSTYTCYQENAYAVCNMFGEPVGPELHGERYGYDGYFCHYHTYDHITPAHSFFYW